MFNQSPRPTDSKGGSVFNRGIALLGGALGIGSAILFTFPIFDAVRVPLLSYLTASWGPSVGGWLTLAMAAVLAVVIYVVTKLVIVLSVTWGAAALAARRFPGT